MLTFWSQGDDIGIPLHRLDCNFQWSFVQGPNNHSPENPLSSDVVYVPNPCSIAPGNLGYGFALVYAEDLASLECSKEDAVKHLAASLTNLTGVIVMARQNFELEVIGQEAEPGSGPNPPILATMVPYNEELLTKAQNGSFPILYGFDNHGPGNFLVVDSKGTMHEIGYLINPWLSTLGWAAQYWVYRKHLRTTLSQVSATQSIMREIVSQGRSVVDLSTFQALDNNKTTALYIDAELSCPGAWNADCPIWDHVASLTVQCEGTGTNNSGAEEPGGSFSEIARYVTPYRLGAGKWTTDITDLAPLLQMKSCVFNVTMPRWSTDAWIWSFSLRARMPLHAPSCPDCGSGLPFQTANLFSNKEPVLRQTFNASYNSERLQQISIPAGAKWAHLHAIITGHGEDETGCCEFLPSRHVFTLNNEEFAVEFMEPLSTFACTKASSGVEPNGFGAWWLGRNGWCNGEPVKPTLFDVTSALSPNGTTIQATYRGLSWNSTTKQWVEPFATRGYILMSSHLSFYA